MEVRKIFPDTVAAEILSVKRQTLANWRSAGRGPAFVKVGRAVRYRPEDLEEFIQKHTVKFQDNVRG